LNSLTTKSSVPSRGRVKHGINFWLRTGKVNPSIRGYKKIQQYLVDLEKQLIDESGGAANLTAAREILIRSTIRAYGVVMLAELYASRYSVIRPDQAKHGVLALQPMLEHGYTGILAQIRANLSILGLDKREPEEVFLTIEQLGAKIDAEAAEKDKAAQKALESAPDGPGSDCEGKTMAGRTEPWADSGIEPDDDIQSIKGEEA
jgi:hypothetical protein